MNDFLQNVDLLPLNGDGSGGLLGGPYGCGEAEAGGWKRIRNGLPADFHLPAMAHAPGTERDDNPQVIVYLVWGDDGAFCWYTRCLSEEGIRYRSWVVCYEEDWGTSES